MSLTALVRGYVSRSVVHLSFQKWRSSTSLTLSTGCVSQTKDEDEAFMDCVADLVTAGLSQAIKQYPGFVYLVAKLFLVHR